MVDVTRRLFVFGGAAAVAAVAIPKVIDPPPQLVVSAPAPMTFDRREIFDLLFGYPKPPEKDVVARVGLMVRGNEKPFYFNAINSRATLRWRSPPGGHIVLLPRDPLFVNVESEASGAIVNLVGRDIVGEMQRGFVEEYRFERDGEPPSISHYWLGAEWRSLKPDPVEEDGDAEFNYDDCDD